MRTRTVIADLLPLIHFLRFRGQKNEGTLAKAGFGPRGADRVLVVRRRGRIARFYDTGGNNQVPEPGTLVLLGMAALGFAVSRRRDSASRS
jgi:PEP-CTERM motif-containing protein